MAIRPPAIVITTRPYHRSTTGPAEWFEPIIARLERDGFVGHYQFFYDPDIYLIMHVALNEPPPDAPGDSDQPTDPGDPSVASSDESAGCAAGGGSTAAAGVSLLGAALALLRRRRSSRPS